MKATFEHWGQGRLSLNLMRWHKWENSRILHLIDTGWHSPCNFIDILQWPLQYNNINKMVKGRQLEYVASIAVTDDWSPLHIKQQKSVNLKCSLHLFLYNSCWAVLFITGLLWCHLQWTCLFCLKHVLHISSIYKYATLKKITWYIVFVL